MERVERASPRETRLLVPANDVVDPVLSIVVPALNEEITIGAFVDWCREGIARLGVPAEILIIDSSSDRTPQIALERGARVLRTPKRGLGRAYIDALPYVRGKYLILGDADCTYDFRELAPFYEKFREGCEFIMGSRFRGSIEDGAMPPLHRYFGTPATTMILNTMYRTHFSDIHCGMRGITKEAFERMKLASQSWEYASEMVLKSVHMGLRQAEVPVRFLKEPHGRMSHHVRAGWFSPWYAGWINLRAMFVFGADFFLWWPGVLLSLIGGAGLLTLMRGPLVVMGVGLSLNTMLLSLVTLVVGVQMVLTGIVASVITDGQGMVRSRWSSLLEYTRTTLLAFAAFMAGLFLVSTFIWAFISAGFRIPDQLDSLNHLAIFGLALMLCSILVFTNMLVMHSALVHLPRIAARSKGR
jgi:glycosyltransferase involved in cell wall biosynthesis